VAELERKIGEQAMEIDFLGSYPKSVRAEGGSEVLFV
jgi:hypothetical protein